VATSSKTQRSSDQDISPAFGQPPLVHGIGNDWLLLFPEGAEELDLIADEAALEVEIVYLGQQPRLNRDLCCSLSLSHFMCRRRALAGCDPAKFNCKLSASSVASCIFNLGDGLRKCTISSLQINSPLRNGGRYICSGQMVTLWKSREIKSLSPARNQKTRKLEKLNHTNVQKKKSRYISTTPQNRDWKE